jgi:DNA-binding response OmpR family regulator
MANDILVIDDDRELNSLLKNYLEKSGLSVLSATDPEEGLKLFRKKKPLAVILDVMLPGKDGFEVCREIRKESAVPVIMLTARGEVTDRVVGLEIGADDYLPKPFDPRELLARIRTVLRRSASKAAPAQGTFSSGELRVSLPERQAWLKSKKLALTTTEFDILGLFLKNPGTVMDRERILNSIRTDSVEVFDRSVDLAISRLRAKLGDSGKDPKYIKTIWGSGYLFSGKVSRRDS